MKSMTDSFCRQGEKEEERGEGWEKGRKWTERKERGGEKSLQQLSGCLVSSTVTTRELSTEFDVFSSLVEVMPHSQR